ncbi:armadillo-type protein, partial [Kalaharituber pfeilii]
TSQYAPQEPRHPPPSRGSSSSDYVHPSPRPSVDFQRRPRTPKTNGDAIALYTPAAYTPSSQRNFHGQGYEIGLKARPKSAYYAPAPGNGFCSGDGIGIGGLRVSNGRGSWDGTRMSMDERRGGTGSSSGESVRSGDSKTGSDKSDKSNKPNSECDKMDIDKAFEALLDNRGVAPNMRQKLRNLDPRVKQHFINNESELENVGASPIPPQQTTGHGHSHSHTLGGVSGLFSRRPHTNNGHKHSISTVSASEQKKLDEPFDLSMGATEGTPTKRARPRSRTFGLGKDKERSSSPTKKQKPTDSPPPQPSPKKPTMRLKSTLLAPVIPTSSGEVSPTKATRGGTVPPDDYVTYLSLAITPARKKNSGMKDVEVAKLHKLRLFLRNERLRWVEDFILLGGLSALIDVLYRCLNVEWREEHEDNILHELLLCLKALCTASMALEKLRIVEKELFSRLVDMIFDEERKGPSEFTTRGIVFSMLFTYLAAAPVEQAEGGATNKGSDTRATRATRILEYLSDKPPGEHKRPIDFIEKIHTKRPYKRWCKEVTNVTKEVFWIFLHSRNVIDIEPTDIPTGDTYAARHFPQERPPVPAAPYVGGVEWEATTYLATHLDLLNGIIASLETQEERNVLRKDLQNSGWEKVMGGTLRTCKERLHGCSAVHDGLKTWVKASIEDGWRIIDVQTGNFMMNNAPKGGRVGLVQPSPESQETQLPIRESPVKRREDPVPKVALDLPTLNLGAKVEADGWAF